LVFGNGHKPDNEREDTMSDQPTELQLKAKLYAKVNAIAKELGKMEADGRNEHSRYSFISYEHMNARLRNLLPAHNLAIVPEVVSFEERDFKDDKVCTRTIASMRFMLVDIDTGYSETREWRGADQDKSGKSGGKSVTEAQKRFEFKLFHVSSRDDIDPDATTTEVSGAAIDTRDPIAFVRDNAGLKAECHRLKLRESDVKRIVLGANFNEAAIKAELSRIGEF
jgi:hypothetical protein